MHLGPACCPVLAASIRSGGLRACNTAWRDSTETGGSATELSATDAWRGAAVGDAMHIRLIGTIARSNFRKRRRAGRLICTRAHARASQREKPLWFNEWRSRPMSGSEGIGLMGRIAKL